MDRARLFSPYVYNASDDQLRREHHARARRWAVILAVALALAIWWLVWMVRGDFATN